LKELHDQRRKYKKETKNIFCRRQSLTKIERDDVIKKTGGLCHVCGGKITGDDWEADHVSPRGVGGKHRADNYLAAHSVCHNYRWFYGPEEFQWILKRGVFIRTHIEEPSRLGRDAGEKFSAKNVGATNAG